MDAKKRLGACTRSGLFGPGLPEKKTGMSQFPAAESRPDSLPRTYARAPTAAGSAAGIGLSSPLGLGGCPSLLNFFES